MSHEPETPEPTEDMLPEPVTLVCPECGELVSINHIEALLLSLHQQNACPATRVIVGYDE